MIAFATTTIIGIALCALIVVYGKRRDVALRATWGEAMAAAGFVFFVMFWFYGVVPHQWLAWADNELNWRADAVLVKPNAFFPLTITKAALKDTIAVGIYGGALVAHVALFMHWQNRGRARPAELPTSRYGRPLVKKA